jgi:hypothetical protein
LKVVHEHRMRTDHEYRALARIRDSIDGGTT